MTASTMLLVALLTLALGIGLGVGVAQLLARRRRRRTRSPGSYPFEAALGFNYLVSNELDRALSAFARVASADPDAVDVLMVLGNLYREKGQVERAVKMHRELLARGDLTPRERTLALFCLALDFKKGGFVDRAAAMLQEVLEIEPRDREALGQLEKLYEGMRDWARAYEAASHLHAVEGGDDERVLAFLRNQMGEDTLRNGDLRAAQRHFEAALAHDRHCAPALLNLGGLFLGQRKFKRAKAAFEEMLERDPRRLGLVWRRLLGAYRALGEESRLEELCRGRIASDPEDWRAFLVLGDLAEERRDYDAAAAFYTDALRRNPQSFALHHRLLDVFVRTKADPERLREYLDLCEEAMTVTDRYICLKCHYRAGELLWRCPSCQEWDPFVEEQG
jgi:lipopolysaccharide biosynthesis regulator YciM